MTAFEEKIKKALIIRPGEGIFYTIDDKKYIRVTHPLSYWVPPQLKNWFIKNTQKAITEKKESTASQGTAIHRKAEEGTEDRLTALLASMGAKIVHNEVVAWSRNGWAGAVDLVIEMNGKLYVGDIKSGRFSTAWPQMGAYSLALSEMGLPIEGYGVISLPRDETREASWWDYSEHFEEGQLQWTMFYDFWKRSEYKQLKDWEFLEGYATFDYNWSPEIIKKAKEKKCA